MAIRIDPATEADVPQVLAFIRGLAEFEKLTHQLVATEDTLRATLFGDRPYAEVLIARVDGEPPNARASLPPPAAPDIPGAGSGEPAGFALFFHNYSTFLAQPGIYLEDLFVLPEFRHRGVGKALLTRLAQIAQDRNCGRLEWSVLDWNQPAIDFYQRLGATVLPDWRVCRMTAAEINQLATA